MRAHVGFKRRWDSGESGPAHNVGLGMCVGLGTWFWGYGIRDVGMWDGGIGVTGFGILVGNNRYTTIPLAYYLLIKTVTVFLHFESCVML